MKVMVISLGGSLIVPNEVDYKFLKNFKRIITKLSKKYKFVIVTGGGRVARIYINALAKEGLDEKTKSLIGIGITRFNARFMARFFEKIAGQNIPHSLREVKNMLAKDKIIFAGGLRYEADNTSDGTSAHVANLFKANLINLTNVNGLYTKNPKVFKDAKFIPKISINDFYKIATKIKYKAGQHFVLDQHAATLIKRYRIKTYILNGKNLKNFENFLKGKRFIGTAIY